MAKSKSKVDKNEKRKMPEDKAETPNTKKQQVAKESSVLAPSNKKIQVKPPVPMETDNQEKKVKKEQKKGEKKPIKKEAPGKTKQEPAKAPSGANSIQYLESFNKKQPGWKFHKSRQIWLLTHMYDVQKISDKHFKMLLKYLEGLKGNARAITVKKSGELMKEYNSRSGKRDEADERRMKRIREVLQLLA